jgi:hypothetical protein
MGRLRATQALITALNIFNVMTTTLSQQQLMYGQSLQARMSEIEGMPEGAEIRKILVDTKNPIDKSFQKFGHLFYNVYVMNGRGKWTPESGMKYWEQNGQYRKLLPYKTPVYVFEQMDNDIEATISTALKSSKFQIVRRDFSHNGFAAYWTLLSDLRKTVRGSYRKDDVVQIGLTLRNGINNGIALGADFFTKCLACENGAVGRGQNFGSLSIRHVGDQKKMIETFKNGIPMVVKLGERIVEYYEKATKIKLENRAVQHLYKRTGIADNQFPDYVAIDKDQKELEKKVTLTKEGRGITLWELFNDLTEKLTKSLNHTGTEKIKGEDRRVVHLGFSTFSNRTRALHKSLVNIADNRINKAEA